MHSLLEENGNGTAKKLNIVFFGFRIKICGYRSVCIPNIQVGPTFEGVRQPYE
jgi:hypothetical protein